MGIGSSTKYLREYSYIFLGLLFFGCGSSNSGTKCTPGRSVACDCTGGRQGVQMCLDTATFGPCQCSNERTDGGLKDQSLIQDDAAPNRNPDLSEETEESGPRFISIGTNVLSLTWGESVVFSAVLTDPDGIEDLIGGTLMTADGLLKYGSFATSSQEGSYSITLDWHQINQSIPIEFATEERRIFVAEFWDAAGHRAAKNVELRLHCKGIGACGGYCIDLFTDTNNCTACGKKCDGICSLGKCWDGVGICISDDTTFYPTNYHTCDEFCSKKGLGACVSGIRYDKQASGNYNCTAATAIISCSDVFNYSSDQFRCCCSSICTILY